MIEWMKNNKKLAVTVVSALVQVALAFVPDSVLDAATKADLSIKLIGAFSIYVLGQGVADHGKERAKVDLTRDIAVREHDASLLENKKAA